MSGNAIKEKWEKVAGFDFRKLLEDNQDVSLPMITQLNGSPALFAFVYSLSPREAITVTQRHIWFKDEHRIILCKKKYAIKDRQLSPKDEEEYLDALDQVTGTLFSEQLTVEETERCKKYLTLFGDDYLRAVYLAENKPLARWVLKKSLL